MYKSQEKVHSLQKLQSVTQTQSTNNPTGLQEASKNAKGKEKIEEFGIPHTIVPTSLQKVLPIMPKLQINEATVPVPSTPLKQIPRHQTDASLRSWATLSFQLQANKTPWLVSAGIKV